MPTCSRAISGDHGLLHSSHVGVEQHWVAFSKFGFDTLQFVVQQGGGVVGKLPYGPKPKVSSIATPVHKCVAVESALFGQGTGS